MLAYLDSFAGHVPCRICAVGDWSDGQSEARIQFTATRGAYKRGTYHTTPLWTVFPRSALHVHDGIYRIWPYSWKAIVGR